MDKPLTTSQIPSQEIEFANRVRRQALYPPAGTAPPAILAALGLQAPRPTILITGGAGSLDRAMHDDPALAARLFELYSHGVARAALETGAAIVAGGTHSGVMKLIGRGVADHGHRTPLIGVTPRGKALYPGGPDPDQVRDGAPLDPNHSHFVLIDGDRFGDESDTIFALTEALAQGSSGPEAGTSLPVVVVVAGGNVRGISYAEVLDSVRHGWPFVVLEGSGGVADLFAGLWRWQKEGQRNALSVREKRRARRDAALIEIGQKGDLVLFAETRDACDLRSMLAGLLRRTG